MSVQIKFDVSTLNPQKITGVGMYMIQLFQNLSQHSELKVVPCVKVSRLKNRRAIETLLGTDVKTLWPLTLGNSRDSLYHGPDFKLNTRGAISKIVTVHDLVVFEEKYNAPPFFKKAQADMKRVLENPELSAVIVNSDFTKKQLLRFFPQWEGRVYKTYLGCNPRVTSSVPQLPSPLALPEQYILFLGTLEKRKNVVGLIEAFEIIRRKGFHEKLVLAGGWGFGDEEIRCKIEASSVKEHIYRLNYVPESHVNTLYLKAQVFCFPSWYEGFGIPVLEAMALGCPVVASSIGSLQEIAGSAALLAPPEAPEVIADALAQVLKDPSLREELKTKGQVRSRAFTWQNCADQTATIYKQVIPVSIEV